MMMKITFQKKKKKSIYNLKHIHIHTECTQIHIISSSASTYDSDSELTRSMLFTFPVSTTLVTCLPPDPVANKTRYKFKFFRPES